MGQKIKTIMQNKEGGNEGFKRKSLVKWTFCGRVTHEGVGGGDKKRRISFSEKYSLQEIAFIRLTSLLWA